MFCFVKENTIISGIETELEQKRISNTLLVVMVVDQATT
jgi:hypothetical protein